MQTPIVVVMCACAVWLSGCATTYEPTAYFATSRPLVKSEHLDGVYRAAAFNPRAYDALLIEVEEQLPTLSPDFPVQKFSRYLELELRSQMEATRAFDHVVTAEAELPARRKALWCRLAITEMDPGSRAMRWWFGEFGAGHSYVQVEGSFVDAHSGEELFRFAERRRGSAVLDITGGDSQLLIEQDLREISMGIVKELFFAAP